MKIDQHDIQQTLRLIASGRLDPLQAARQILSASSGEVPDPRLRTLESVISELGPPPPEIQSDWLQQIDSLADRWQQTHQQPLPALTLEDLLIDDENRISLRWASPAAARMPVPAQMLDPSQQPEIAAAVVGSRPLTSTARRFAAVGVVAAAAGAAALLVHWHRGAAPAALATATDAPLAQPSNAPSAPLSPQRPERSPSEGTEPPHTDFGRNDLILSDVPPPAEDSAALQLPGVAAASDDSLADDLLAGPPASQATPADGQALLWQDDGEDDLSNGEDELSDASGGGAVADRPTLSSAPADAISLPPLPPAGEHSPAERIFASAVRDIRWQYPLASTLSLHQQAADAWSLVDSADAAALATLHSSDDGLWFQWTSVAASSIAARQVAAGRLQLTNAAGELTTLWLRPRLQSSPLRIDLTKSQTSAFWSLDGPPIPSSGELAVEVDVPDDVQLQWIQKADPQNLRKNLSLLQWTPAGATFPAIRCQIELRTSSRLLLKMRYAAQLDESMPWHHFSAPQLAAASDRFADALNQSLLQQAELGRRYSAANTAGKRLIKPSKDALDQSVRRLQMLVQRINELQSLQTTIAAQSRIRIALMTHWPDGRQTILEMPGDPLAP